MFLSSQTAILGVDGVGNEGDRRQRDLTGLNRHASRVAVGITKSTQMYLP